MSTIQVLDSHVADLIAAGEVVERPASVAKELMENAIDAGASAVTVEISHGGMIFIRVTDDGKGIPADEVATAFLRHATSKLRTEYDLEAIGTLGFRGEALAAISAVSRMEVLTRTANAPLGASLSLEGGVPGPVEEAGCPLGTTMVVRDLFYNTPARLKFMKKDAAEGAAVFGVVQRTALSHPEISVKFIRDGKQELLTPGDGQLQSAVYAVLGRDLALGFRPVKASGEDITVSGFVSLPACCRPSRTWQFFFVNGRQVKSPLMMAALEEAYKNQKMVGKFPGCVLHLEMKLSAVDVNVHPAKTEVKFGSERQVFSAVYHAVLSALDEDTSHPAFAPRSEERSQLRNERIAGMSPVDTVTPNQTRLTIPAQNTAVRVQDTTFRPVGTPVFRPAPSPETPKATPMVEEHSPEPVHSVSVPRPAAQAPTQPSLVREPLSAPAPEPSQPPQERPVSPPPAPVFPNPTVEESPIVPVSQAPWRMAGEVLNTYIIVEQGDTIFFVDKHAAHERMNFDRMKSEGYDPMAQTLLSPVICHLSAEEQEALLSQLPLLEEFGFDVDELGGSLAVRQAPFDVEVGDIEATLVEIARNLLTTGGADPAAARDELLHTMACKAAIKGGWKTSPQELERVVGAVMTGAVKYCPHGRPVAIELTRKELEKQFKRA
ncbi:MAG: DNA mismatch repair endonuclease MutL [Lawsonibacter sp.]